MGPCTNAVQATVLLGGFPAVRDLPVRSGRTAALRADNVHRIA